MHVTYGIMFLAEMFEVIRGFYRHMIATEVVYCQHHIIIEKSDCYPPQPANSFRIRKCNNFAQFSSLVLPWRLFNTMMVRLGVRRLMWVSSKGFQCILQKGNETACLVQHAAKDGESLLMISPFHLWKDRHHQYSSRTFWTVSTSMKRNVWLLYSSLLLCCFHVHEDTFRWARKGLLME